MDLLLPESSFFLSLDLLRDRRLRSLECVCLLRGLLERLLLLEADRRRDLLLVRLFLERDLDLLFLDLDRVRERVRILLLSLFPGSIAAEMSDWASLTLFMASSISLLDASAFRLALRFKPAANGFSFGSVMNFNSWSAA